MKKHPTFVKTLSWLAVSYCLVFAIAWYESGIMWVGMLTALWAALIKAPVYHLHESLWAKFLHVPAKPEPVPVTTTRYELPILNCNKCKKVA